jgi:hypothetical protein
MHILIFFFLTTKNKNKKTQTRVLQPEPGYDYEVDRYGWNISLRVRKVVPVSLEWSDNHMP